MQVTTAAVVGQVVDLNAARAAGRKFTGEELGALESCRLFLCRADDPKDLAMIESDSGDQIAMFLCGDDAIYSVTKSRGEFIALDGTGKLVVRGAKLRGVLVKMFTGADFPGEGYLKAKLKRS